MLYPQCSSSLKAGDGCGSPSRRPQLRWGVLGACGLLVATSAHYLAFLSTARPPLRLRPSKTARAAQGVPGSAAGGAVAVVAENEAEGQGTTGRPARVRSTPLFPEKFVNGSTKAEDLAAELAAAFEDTLEVPEGVVDLLLQDANGRLTVLHALAQLAPRVSVVAQMVPVRRAEVFRARLILNFKPPPEEDRRTYMTYATTDVEQLAGRMSVQMYDQANFSVLERSSGFELIPQGDTAETLEAAEENLLTTMEALYEQTWFDLLFVPRYGENNTLTLLGGVHVYSQAFDEGLKNSRPSWRELTGEAPPAQFTGEDPPDGAADDDDGAFFEDYGRGSPEVLPWSASEVPSLWPQKLLRVLSSPMGMAVDLGRTLAAHTTQIVELVCLDKDARYKIISTLARVPKWLQVVGTPGNRLWNKKTRTSVIKNFPLDEGDEEVEEISVYPTTDPIQLANHMGFALHRKNLLKLKLQMPSDITGSKASLAIEHLQFKVLRRQVVFKPSNHMRYNPSGLARNYVDVLVSAA